MGVVLDLRHRGHCTRAGHHDRALSYVDLLDAWTVNNRGLQYKNTHTSYNSLAPGRCGCNFNGAFSRT